MANPLNPLQHLQSPSYPDLGTILQCLPALVQGFIAFKHLINGLVKALRQQSEKIDLISHELIIFITPWQIVLFPSDPEARRL